MAHHASPPKLLFSRSMGVAMSLAATTAWGGAALLRRRSPIQQSACRLGGLVSGSLGTIALCVRLLYGQPPAEGAAHLGPFVWPVIFGTAGLVTYLAVFVASLFRRHRTPPNKRLEPTGLSSALTREAARAGGSSARR